MPIQQRMVVTGLSAVQVAAIQGTVADNLTATGTSSQAAAFPLPADINRFTTVALNAGALVPPLNPADSVNVYNGGANPLLLYPPTGGTINGLGLNAAYSIATATPYAEVYCISPTRYIASQSA